MGYKAVQKKITITSNSLNEYKTKRVIRELIQHIDSIPDVKSWAVHSNVSRGWLCKATKEIYGLTPKEIV